MVVRRFTSTLLIPAESSVSSQYSSSGFLPIGIKHFGQLSVSGLRRVPKPAASKRALMLDLITRTRKSCGDLEKVHQIIPATCMLHKQFSLLNMLGIIRIY